MLRLAVVVRPVRQILRNPIPLSYTRHTARFLILWLAWLPIALWAKVRRGRRCGAGGQGGRWGEQPSHRSVWVCRCSAVSLACTRAHLPRCPARVAPAAAHACPPSTCALLLLLPVLQVGWGVVPVEAILCYLLLGIDEIAIQMEEPFGEPPLPTQYYW